jgi:hypothetical protein
MKLYNITEDHLKVNMKTKLQRAWKMVFNQSFRVRQIIRINFDANPLWRGDF